MNPILMSQLASDRTSDLLRTARASTAAPAPAVARRIAARARALRAAR